MTADHDPDPSKQWDRQVAAFMVLCGMVAGFAAVGIWLKSCTG